jgi:acetyl-CoA synthetase
VAADHVLRDALDVLGGDGVESFLNRLQVDRFALEQLAAEAAAAGRADPTTGQAIVAFVSLKGGDEGSVAMLEELREHVAKKIGKIARPANIVFTPELPKTRSGKIMPSCFANVSENRKLGDTTTLADPAVVEEIKERATGERAEEE